MTQSYTINSIKSILTTVLLISIMLECAIYPSWENAFGCFAEFYGWFLINRTVLKYEYLKRYLIPVIMLFFYGIYFFVLPIPVTMIEGKPLTFRFAVPWLTFFNLILNATTIVLAFHFCRKIYHEGWLTNIWKRLGYFAPPTSSQIWALGVLGLLALLWGLSYQGSERMRPENLGAWGQFLNVLRQFAYAPVALLFVKYYCRHCANISKRIVYLYIAFFCLLAIATTRRAMLIDMTVSIAVMFLFVSLIENRRLFSPKKIIYLVIGFYLLSGPVADLALSMIINRSTSYSGSASSTFSNVIELYSDKEKLHRAFQMGTFSNSDNSGDNYSAWSEYYIDNIFFDRFCNLRTQDITLDYATKLGYGSERMKEYAANFVLFQVPTPILRAFGYHGNKFENNYTPGDLLSTDALKLNYQYGGFRVAGDSAVGLAWMGYGYYVFAFFIYVLLFYFMCSLVSNKEKFIVPVPVIMAMTTYMTYFNNSTGIFRTLSLLLRSGWQNIIIYCFLMWVIRLFLKGK